MPRKALAMALLPLAAIAAALTPLSADGAKRERLPAERQMLKAVNSERAEHGLAPFRRNMRMQRRCRSVAKAAVRRGSLTHGAALERGFDNHAEALALVNTGAGSTIPRAIAGWLRSPLHRSIVLGSNSHAGTHFARGRFGGRMSVVWCLRTARR